MPLRSPSRKRATAGDPNQKGVEAMLRQITSKPASPELKREAAATVLNSLLAGSQIGGMVAAAAGAGLPTLPTVITRILVKKQFEKKLEKAFMRKERSRMRATAVAVEAQRRYRSNQDALNDIAALPRHQRKDYEQLARIILRDQAKQAKRLQRSTQEKLANQRLNRLLRDTNQADARAREQIKNFESIPQQMLKQQGSATRAMFALEDDFGGQTVEGFERNVRSVRGLLRDSGDR